MFNTAAAHHLTAKAARAVLLAFICLATFLPSPATAATTTIEFQKSFDPAATAANGTPTWTGTITSGSGGTIEMRLVDYREAGKVEHLVLDFTIDQGGIVTTARMSGTFNNSTEQTVLNGTVTSGPWEGATAHEQGVRTDADASAFTGWLRLQHAA